MFATHPCPAAPLARNEAVCLSNHGHVHHANQPSPVCRSESETKKGEQTNNKRAGGILEIPKRISPEVYTLQYVILQVKRGLASHTCVGSAVLDAYSSGHYG